ncbi:alpha-ketoacid dehydrogenase subunit beta [Tessaracoccus sp. OH4464_COT-324]|uniref:alpha-ketoacid dehydrogenase subunit beta n=1 Tax=Tessaracoccus sp. OH4464_COT-324 TaxID=2491059 RepID=UPI000F637CBE|nr:alpha-ketoacid dehydrogenase subunit beta [Tessaracoccus sp. OH4464_COT-324]RRD45724.1 alpha-ketoacid dehydrogenase subunit beta [Tessaracoccus sp. OH4464_COT-324]
MKLTMAKALNRGLRRVLQADPKTLIAGEDVGKLGGVFRVTEGLQAEFGENRVFDSPLAESGIVGTAIGLAMRGYRPIVEIQFDGFVYPAFSQIVSQLSRFHVRTGGRVPMPVVVRIPSGGGIGAVEHHSESVESYFVHTPGLKVVTPSDPHDAYWMIQQAVQSNDPVIFLEPKRRYQVKGEVDMENRPTPLHAAAIRRYGADATLICYGPTVPTCLETAEIAAEEGLNLEVLDLRSLSPIDWISVRNSVSRTKRAVVVHEAPLTLGLGAELAARLHEELFYTMEAPVARVAGYDIAYPSARVEHDYLPGVDRILDAVERSLES